MKKHEQNLRDLCNNIKPTDVWKRNSRRKRAKCAKEKIMAESSYLMENINLKNQEAQ
jgi:hypothetical protein